MSRYVEVNIRKPLHGTFVYIRDKYLRQAKLRNIPLQITIPQGVGIMTYEEFMKGAKQMSKVFKDPEHPMVLYGNYVKLTNTSPKGFIVPPGKSFFDVYEEIPEHEEKEMTGEQLELF